MRRSGPGSKVEASGLPANWHVVKQSSSLWQKHSILSTFYSTADLPHEIHVVLVPSLDFNEPDLLLYWTNDAPLANAMPADAQFVGAFAAGKSFLLPVTEKRAGHLILFSSPYTDRLRYCQCRDIAMSVQYGAISWNRQKRVYDVTLVSLLALYIAIFVGVAPGGIRMRLLRHC